MGGGSTPTAYASWAGFGAPPYADGYSSGGNVKKVLTNATMTAYNLISYLGMADANGITNPVTIAHPCTFLTYNGVFANAANIQNGSYPLWSKEVWVKRPVISTASETIVNAMITAATDATYQSTSANFGKAVFPVTGFMQVDRSADGGPINPNY